MYLDTACFDTAAGLDLAAHKAGRHRGLGWTLRLPVGEDSRDEVGAPGRNRRRPGAELARLVQTPTLGADLRRVATITTYRRRRRMLDAEGVLAADVADDRVVARWASGDTPAWREIGIEVGERGDGDRRCRAGPAVWGAVLAVGRLVVWGLGKLVARWVARVAAL